MRKRKQTSGGQAIVMVTLALVAMCGMMGLAVDLGWSFFVQKQAQAVADGAALAAVHEVFVRNNGAVAGLTCGSKSDCQTSLSPPTSCSDAKITTSSNLHNGCEYAVNNGFDYINKSSIIKVTVVSNIGGTGKLPAPQVTGIPNANIAYWATYRAVETIPQLFSAVLNHTEGTVSAIATAAILAETAPGSFRGMNHEWDCQTTTGGAKTECGVDLDVSGSGQGQCFDGSGAPTQKASVCGPSGIYLSSQCHGSAALTGCTDGGGVQNFAGQNHNGNNKVWGSVNKIQGAGAVSDPSKWTPTPVNGGSGANFNDPTNGEPQPPIAPSLSSGTAITPCPVATGTQLSGANLGPFQYYSANLATGKADGKPLTFASNVQFSSSGICPSNVGLNSNQKGQAFPTYVFYGGVDASAVNTPKGNTTFGPGQYVLAGTTTLNGDFGGGAGYVFTSKGPNNMNGDASTTGGTMFILTDANYPGLVQPPAISTLVSSGTKFYQGNMYLKDSTFNLTGISDALPGSADVLDQYGGILFWGDRRNTSLTASGYYDPSGAWVSCPTLGVSCTPASYDVTNTSPTIILDHGNDKSVFTGVFYQPRGAWMTLNSGTSHIANSPLQVITGSLVFTGGGGNAQVVLLGPTNPLITYRTALIQ